MYVMKTYRGEKVWIHTFLIYVQDWNDWPASRSGRFTHRKIAASAHSLKGSVGSRTRLLTGEQQYLFLCRESGKESSNTYPDVWWIYRARYVGVFHIAKMCDVTVIDWGTSGYSQCWTGVKSIRSWSSYREAGYLLTSLIIIWVKLHKMEIVFGPKLRCAK
jgi:hypothetical protein